MPGPHVISGDKQQIGNRGGGIRTHAVLRDAHRPKNANALASAIMCAIFNSSMESPQVLRGKFQRERLQALSYSSRPLTH